MKLPNRILSRRGFLATSILGGLVAPFLKADKVEAAPAPGFGPPVIVSTINVVTTLLSSLPGGHYTQVGTLGPINVQNSSSMIEITYQGRIAVGTVNGMGVEFQLRIDNTLPMQYSGKGLVMQSEVGAYVHQSFSGYFTNLSPGVHHVEMWAMPISSTAANVFINPGIYYPANLIVKEYLPFGVTYLPLVQNQ